MKSTKRRRVAVMLDVYWEKVNTYEGTQEYAAQAGWDCTIDPFAARTMQMCRGAKPYDGIIGRAKSDVIYDPGRLSVPVVNLRLNLPSNTFPSVFPDFEAIGVMGARHLIGRGCRQLGFLGSSAEAATRLMLKGFRSELKTSGLSCSVRRFKMHNLGREQNWRALTSGLSEWVDTWSTPIGIFSILDLGCHYLIHICRSKGLHVPRDVSLIGVGDNRVVCESASPSITSINPGYVQLGYQAAALLDRLMDGAAPPDQPILVPPAGLIQRESTDSYAVDDPVVARALRFISEHGHEPITVDDIARAAVMTRRSLERRFQKIMQRTIGQELLYMRLERSKRRLAETDEPLKQVAADSGFNSRRSFDRAFISNEGVSPSQYRKERRAEN
ncbi:MAG: substrate-binding domain-containing protein [Phycisphaerae bacterium]|jgi:LacI family transcriptional regulator|nr:substrate-binding domain-containing protein [Phycisphaerae bacterium]